MKAVILEDEQLAAKRLKRLINEVAPDIKIVSTFETVLDTANYLLNNTDVDILFLDIHVADGNSFELFRIIDVKSSVIFTTAYDKYAIEAFRKNATDYLLKPLKKIQLAEAIAKATPINPQLLKDIPSEYKKRIVIQFLSKLYSIKTEDIAYIYSRNKVSYFYTKDGLRYPSDYKLQDLEDLLDAIFFFRVNRQFIINIDAIDNITKHKASRVKITVNPPIEDDIVISTDKTPQFKEWLDR